MRLYSPRIDARWTGFISYGGEAPRPIVMEVQREGARVRGNFFAYADFLGALSYGAITGDPGVLYRTQNPYVEGKLTLIRYDAELVLDPEKPACAMEGRYSIHDDTGRMRLSWRGSRVLGTDCPESAELTAVEDDIRGRLETFAQEVGAAPRHGATPVRLESAFEGTVTVVGVLVVGAFYYVFFGIALVSLARTLGVTRRWRAWFPGLNFVLLLQAARLSNWWALSLFAWPISVAVFGWAWGRIAERRGLPVWPSWLTWIPLVNIPAISYYAFTVPPGQTADPLAPKFCAHCGARTEADARFCGMCGYAKTAMSQT